MRIIIFHFTFFDQLHFKKGSYLHYIISYSFSSTPLHPTQPLFFLACISLNAFFLIAFEITESSSRKVIRLHNERRGL